MSASGGGLGLSLPDPEECDPAVSWECAEERTVRNDVHGTLASDVVLPEFSRDACGSGSDLELVAKGLGSLDRFAFADMPTEGAPAALFFVHSTSEWELAVGRIDKVDCAYEPAFRQPTDLPAAAATKSHLLWRPALGSIGAHFQWDALDGSSSEPLSFATASLVTVSSTEVYLHDSVGDCHIISASEDSTLGGACRIPGESALVYTSAGLERVGRGVWVDLESGAQIELGIAWLGGAPGYWESGVAYEEFLYYCDEGVVRVDRSNDHVRIIDAPCQKLVHVDESGLYFTTPNGLARAGLDGSSPELVAPGGELFDDTHIYFFEGTDLWRIERPTAP